VQNKVDLVEPNQPKEFQKKSYLDDFATKNGFSGVCLTSAKDNKNIEECFQQLLGNDFGNPDEIIKRGLIKDLKPSTATPATTGDGKTTATVKLTTNAPRTEPKKKCC
jgi:hypothetical protein